MCLNHNPEEIRIQINTVGNGILYTGAIIVVLGPHLGEININVYK